MPISERRRGAALAGVALLLAGCSPPSSGERGRSAAASTEPPAADALSIPCSRADGSRPSTCTVERSRDNAGTVLTLRADDGGFRRLRVVTDGRGLVAADGAQPAVVTVVGPASIDVRVGDERYRLPATIAR